MLPISWQQTDGMRFITSVGVAIGTGLAAHFVLPAPYRDAVIAGAGAQALSVGLNPIVKNILGSKLPGGLMGVRRNAMGDFVPAQFPEPHNPIYLKMYQAALQAAAPGAGGAAPSMAGMAKYAGRWN